MKGAGCVTLETNSVTPRGCTTMLSTDWISVKSLVKMWAVKNNINVLSFNLAPELSKRRRGRRGQSRMRARELQSAEKKDQTRF